MPFYSGQVVTMGSGSPTKQGETPAQKAEKARQAAFGLTSGVSDRIMGDAQVQQALQRLQASTAEGPLSQQVQGQIANRNAGQLARAEGVNAEQLRMDAANAGLSPNDPGYQAALRQGQAQRQSNQIAFAGDLATRAAQTNYDAQNNAARALASTRLGQYGQAQPGYNWAANLHADTQYGGGREPAVSYAPPQQRQQPASSGPAFGFSNDSFASTRPRFETMYRSGGKDVTEQQYNQDRAAGRGMTNYGGSPIQPNQINPVGGSPFGRQVPQSAGGSEQPLWSVFSQPKMPWTPQQYSGPTTNTMQPSTARPSFNLKDYGFKF